MSTDRIMVHDTVAEKFKQALQKAAAQSSKGDSSERPTIVSTASKARAQSTIASALASGARVLVGSGADEGKDAGVRITPTILDNVDQHTDVWNNECFAPLAACMTVESDNAAVALANQGGYGLLAAIFTEDLRKGFALAKQIESGYVLSEEVVVNRRTC